MNKKLQVFVSSTYKDLMEERQAAVEAILDAGHIPAGMELFKAGNESQLKTIYKWIDESDVYMLILGGRYGSVAADVGKSYTQLEYEYALEKGIPVFAVVLSQEFLKKKIIALGLEETIEHDAPEKYQSFKTLVMSKIIREVDDCKDIKISIHSTLNDFMNQYDLVGWVRNSNENDTIQLLRDNADLLKENNLLNTQIQELQRELNAKAKEQFGNYTFDELAELFHNKKFEVPARFTKEGEDCTISALEFLILYHDTFVTGVTDCRDSSVYEAYIFHHIAPYYYAFGFMERVKLFDTNAQRIHITKLGSSFYAMLEFKGMTEKRKQ